MTPEEEVLGRVVRRLEVLGIPYMVTGSMASSHHGRPRATHDVDVVIDPTPGALDHFVEQLSAEGFYVDARTAREALRRRRQFNAIEMRTAVKIDLIVRKDRPFSLEELSRRHAVELPGGTAVRLATPEDTIVSKLEWARRGGGSAKQLADVAGVLEVSGTGLDRDYIERWARELGVLDLWRRVVGPSAGTDLV